MKLHARLGKIASAIDGLTLRERLMLFVAALIVLGGIWEGLLAAPLAERETAARAEVASIRKRLEQLDASMELAAQGIGGGMSGQAERLQRLRAQLREAEATVEVFTSDLIGPAEMRHVLEELIDGQQGLKLIRASNLEVRPVIEADSATGPSGRAVAEEPVLYRHGLRLELEGGYLDCLAYLEAVEQLPWRIYWGSLSLVSEDYPVNRIAIELFTLSLDEEWIGV